MEIVKGVVVLLASCGRSLVNTSHVVAQPLVTVLVPFEHLSAKLTLLVLFCVLPLVLVPLVVFKDVFGPELFTTQFARMGQLTLLQFHVKACHLEPVQALLVLLQHRRPVKAYVAELAGSVNPVLHFLLVFPGCMDILHVFPHILLSVLVILEYLST